MNEILTAISTVGFPIVMCVFLGWYINKTQDKNNEIIQENTKTLTHLSTLLERLFKRLDIDEDKKGE